MLSALLLLILQPIAHAGSNVIPVSRESKSLRSLGAGYNSRSQILMGICVDNQNDKGESPQESNEMSVSSFDLRLQKDEQAIARKLGVSGSGRYKTGVTEVSASAEFVNSSASNEYSLSYTFASEHYQTQKLEASRAFPIRPLPSFEKSVGNAKVFFDRCGDEFVQRRHMSAQLFVNVNIAFVSTAERTRFASELGVRSSLSDLKAKLESDNSRFSSSNRVSIRALQVGGQPEKVGRILCPANNSGQPDPNCEKSSRDFANCSFGNVGKCLDVIANAVAYSNSQDGDNFPSQIANGKNFVVTALETMAYTNLGEPFTPPPSPQRELEFQAARKDLLQIFDSQYKLWTYASSLYENQAPRLSDRQRTLMEGLKNTHFKNMSRTALAIDTCYDSSYEECSKEVDVVRKFIGIDRYPDIASKQYDSIHALTEPETFVQYCDLADSEHPFIRQTFEALLAYAQSTDSSKKATLAPLKDEDLKHGDRCTTIGDWLNAQKELDLSQYPELKIGDLGPISTLKNLERLNLKGRKIENIFALAKLTNLQELNLDDNLIADVSPLVQLTNLKSLSIQNNRVEPASMATLAALNSPRGNLAYINAAGNTQSLTCPLAEATGCKLMSFANYANIASASTICRESAWHQGVAVSPTDVLITGGATLSEVYDQLLLVSTDGCRPLPYKLTTRRYQHSLTKTERGIWVIGGGTNKIELIDGATFQPSLASGTLKHPVTRHTATRLPDGRILVVGGSIGESPILAALEPSAISDLIQIVNVDGSVEIVGSLKVPRAEHTATLLRDGRVLILGGYSLNHMVDIAEVIDPAAKTIDVLPEPLPIGRANHAATLLPNGHVLIAGGDQWTEKLDAKGEPQKVRVPVGELVDFDPAANAFRVLRERLSPARTRIQAVATNDGRVLLFGGTLASVKTKEVSLLKTSSEVSIYDPKSEGVYHVAEMMNHLWGFSATALGNNSVLIFGGMTAWSTDTSDGKNRPEKLRTSVQLLVYRPRP